MNSQELISVGKSVLRPSHSGDIVEWLESNVMAIPDSPMPGPFRSERTPWLAEALRIASDPETRLLVILASIQSGKSLFARLMTCDIVANNPGPTMVLQATDAEAKDFALRYLKPVWENTPLVKQKIRSVDNERSTTTDFDRMPVYCRGILNNKNLQRLSLRYVIVDECWLAPQGHLAEVSARVTAFGWMGKRVFMSQGGVEGQEFHQMHETTDMRDWNFCCMKCGQHQPWKWDQVQIPNKKQEKWDYLDISLNTKYKCVHCNELLDDTNYVRQECNSKGKFIATKEAVNKSYVGLHWNSLATMSWGELAVMMIKAKEAFEEYGDDEPMRIFIQKRLAEIYKQQVDEVVVDATTGEYLMGDDWSEEGGFINGKPTSYADITPDMRNAPGFVRLRFMGVDVQKRGFYYLIRGWSGDGRSRLIDCGYVNAWTHLVQVQNRYQINPLNVFVDSGYMPDEVLSACAANGWVATRGDQRNDFPWNVKTPAGIKKELRPYSVPSVENVNGKRVKRFFFSNLRLKDILSSLIRRGKSTRPKNISQDYLDQMKSERRTLSPSGKPIWERMANRDNHFWDCEVMCLLPAIAWKLTGRPEDVMFQEEEEVEKTD